jgi:hypothetical protein
MEAVVLLGTRFSRRRRVARITPELRTNLSLVLHECSTSPAVTRTAQAAAAHAARLWRTPETLPLVTERGLPAGVDLVLTARVGLPARLSALLEPETRLRFVDHLDEQAAAVTFFRAPARLALPALPGNMAVAAVILRPGGRDAQLVVDGPFDWPAEQDEVVWALERLLQRFPEQWFPDAALWAAPAEVLLADEIR